MTSPGKRFSKPGREAPDESDARTDERAVYTIRLRRDRELRAMVHSYRGEQFAALREFWQPSEELQTWLATKRCITLRVRHLADLQAAVIALRQAAADAQTVIAEKDGDQSRNIDRRKR